MQSNIKELVSQLTLEEKAGLCSGLDYWHTKAVERLGIPSILMTDGPAGLRKQAESADHLGLNASVPATCFPLGCALACSWDKGLLLQVGAALGEECRANGVSILLGPAVNIKRSPLCGRNFEYFSEDPFLSAELGVGYVNGLQSTGVGASAKHFAANSQEENRMTIDERIDERTLREIYLASFEGIVKKAQPWTVMCAYNRINGTFCSEHRGLLTEALKEEWGHKGFVMSDWGAVDDRVAGLDAGMELEMPATDGVNDRKIVEAVRSGRLSEKKLDDAVERLLTVIYRAVQGAEIPYVCDMDRHHELASKVAEECIVLLKNENAALPLNKKGTYAVLGGFAQAPRYQGGGSSHINPTRVEKPLEELKKAAPEASFLFAPGFEVENAGDLFAIEMFSSASNTPNAALIGEAERAAAGADAAVVFLGLPESYESEGFDRRNMRLPEGQLELLKAVCRVQRHVVVVLQNGSAVEMPWAGSAEAIVECYLGGQAGSSAAARVLFGDANPCGKLAETFPQRLGDTPAYLNFPGSEGTVEYREGIFVGYRYYEARGLEPLYPFGYGLSYTAFRYESLSVDRTSMREDETLTATVRVRNTGSRAGKEIVELYVRDCAGSVQRPNKELKGFAKVYLEPGEAKEVSIPLSRDAFAFFSGRQHRWVVESGDFELLAGPSSADTPLSAAVSVEALAEESRAAYGRNTTLNELSKDPKAYALLAEYFPIITQLPLSLAGSIPVRSFSLFGKAEKVEQFLEVLTGSAADGK